MDSYARDYDRVEFSRAVLRVRELPPAEQSDVMPRYSELADPIRVGLIPTYGRTHAVEAEQDQQVRKNGSLLNFL